MHNTLFPRWLALIAAMLLLAAGCSTPTARIRENRALYETFPMEARALVQQGKVDVGFTPDMVYLAKGHPDRKYSRRTDAGATEIWSYVQRRYWTDRQRVEMQVRVRDTQGRLRTVTESDWVDVQQEREYEQVRIEFVNGKVFAVEELTP